MARILLLGTSGMLGGQLLKTFQSLGHTVIGYSRAKNYIESNQKESYNHSDIFSNKTKAMIAEVNPDYLINCIGVIKQRENSQNAVESIKINSLLPHFLEGICSDYNIKIIHFSTDCVFTGAKGGYIESDTPDATDLYGKSKLLGELCGQNSLTIRTSIIGHEASNKRSLLEWALSNKSKPVRGFKNAIFSGLTTFEMANVIDTFILKAKTNLNGLFHVSTNPISKFDLLTLISQEYELNLKINAEYKTKIKRDLDSRIFQSLTGYTPKAWPKLISEMKTNFLEKNK